MNGEFGGVVNTPVKHGNVLEHVVVATFTSGAGAFTQDTVLSSPGAVLTRSAAGNFTVTLPGPRPVWILPYSHMMTRAVTLAASSQLFMEVLDNTGALPTVTYVTQAANALGTDADPASGDVLRIVIRTGGF